MIPALLLAQAAMGPVLDAAPPLEHVRLGWDAKARLCGVQVHGAEIGDPRTDAGRAALVQALPDQRKGVDLLGATDVPFVCLQAVLDTLRTNGRRYRVGLVSPGQPPKP
ncbi:MAG TPA: hypothetical protein VGC10_05505 [Sphingomonas sp.]